MITKPHQTQKSIILLFFCCLSLVPKAQVVIGKETLPESYSLLKIESEKGLRLPQMNTSQRDKLAVINNISDPNNTSKGLMIFNTDTKDIEYWDGEKWVSIPNEGDFQSTDLTSSAGGTLLHDVNASIKPNVVTLPKLKGAIDDPSNFGKIYGTDATGKPIFIPKADVMSIVDATNGLNMSADKFIELGGTLTDNTDIQLLDQNLKLTSTTGNFEVNNTASVNNALIVNNKVGVNLDKKNQPQVSLHINGAMAMNESPSTWTDATTVAIPDGVGQATIDPIESVCPLEVFKITLPKGVAGQRLVIINNTAFTGVTNGTKAYRIGEGRAMEFVFSNSAWRSSVQNTTATDMYVGTLIIPPFWVDRNNSLEWNVIVDGTHPYVARNVSYDTPDWKILRKSNRETSDMTRGATITAYYEYTGDKPFNVKNLYPLFCTGNRSSFLDTFVANFVFITNEISPLDGQLRTRIKVAITRTDEHNTNDALWKGSSEMNLMLTNSNR